MNLGLLNLQMKNKFIEKYPQLREPKNGDIVEIIKLWPDSKLFDLPYYKIGSKCKIHGIYYSSIYDINLHMGNFNNFHKIPSELYGICDIGLYNIHFKYCNYE